MKLSRTLGLALTAFCLIALMAAAAGAADQPGSAGRLD